MLLAAILLSLLTQKLAFDPEPIGHGRADGSFYYQVARHVASGDGLRTSVSLYNQGLRELPAPTTITPLWPLVLGATGRWIGLPRATLDEYFPSDGDSFMQRMLFAFFVSHPHTLEDLI